MAEKVQEILDRMVPAMIDWEERGIFSSSEIQSIVGRRRQYEYLLQRRNPRKCDYITYIQSEIQLEQLRALRTKRIHRERQQAAQEERRKRKLDSIDDNDNPKKNGSSSSTYGKGSFIGDYHVISFIHTLYHRLLKKYKNEIELFIQYAEFCKEHGANNQLSKCYAEALQYHPHAIPIWIEAASHEYFNNHNIMNARILLQRAIRINSVSSTRNTTTTKETDHTSKATGELWIQLFTLELHFIAKMTGRKKILSSIGAKKAKSTIENNSNDFCSNEEYKLVKIVYDNAIQSSAAKTNIEERFRFMDVCKQFPASDELQNYILTTIMNDFASSSPQAWIARAITILSSNTVASSTTKTNNVIINGNDNGATSTSASGRPITTDKSIINDAMTDISSSNWAVDDAINTIRTACKTVSTAEMFLHGIRFLRSLTDTYNKVNDNSDHRSDTITKQCKDCVLELFDTLCREHNHFNSTDLVLEHIDYISSDSDNGAKFSRGRSILEHYVRTAKSKEDTKSKTAIPAMLWLKWAEYTFKDGASATSPINCDVYKSTIAVLQKGLQSYTVDDVNYTILLLQLLGLHMYQRQQDLTKHDDPDSGLENVFYQLLSIAPGIITNKETLDCIESVTAEFVMDVNDCDSNESTLAGGGCPFIICNIPMALYKYLLCHTRYCTNNSIRIRSCRKVYETVLFQSTIIKLSLQFGDHLEYGNVIKLFINECIDVESAASSVVEHPTNNGAISSRQNNINKNSSNIALKRLYDFSINTFSGSNPCYADEYRQRLDDHTLCFEKYQSAPSTIRLLYQKLSKHQDGGKIPFFDVSLKDYDPIDSNQAFHKFKVVHLRNVPKKTCEFEKSKESSILSWEDIYDVFQGLCAEDKASWCVETKKSGPITEKFLSRKYDTNEGAYCSFLVQKDKDNLLKIIDRLPVTELPWKKTCAYENALWMFFGRNAMGNANLDGRPDHTDSISHDGTWHYQLSGSKRWFIRPTDELLALMKETSNNEDLPVTTSWQKHDTLQVDCKEGDILVINTRLWFHRTSIPPQCNPSVSYARDFTFNTNVSNDCEGMTNVDGLYATSTIEADTIIFHEVDIPDCELHISANPNCAVVELDDGSNAVVSIRKIATGEFFCVKQDSSDESNC